MMAFKQKSSLTIKILGASTLLALVGMFPSLLAHAQSEQKIAVLVNDHPITAYDVTQRIRLLTLNSKSAAKLMRTKVKSPKTNERFREFVAKARQTSLDSDAELQKRFIKKLQDEVRREIIPTLRKKAIDELIDERLMLQDAKKLNIVVSEEDVKRRIEFMAKNSKNRQTGKSATSEEFLKQLKTLGVNIKAFKEKLRAQVAFQRVLRRKYGRDIQTSAQQQAVKILDKAGSEGVASTNTEFQLQKVNLSLPDGADQQKIAARLVEAEKLRRKFSSCKDTSKLIKSVKGSSMKTLGTRTASQVEQPIRAILLQARAGEMTPPSVTGTSIELYAVCSRRQAKGNSPERRKLQAKFQQQELSVVSLRHLKNIRQDALIDYR
ncbi:chaperone SurA [bacterium MnTg02]|nr:chaperone SurA [bacterium MnTg02]